MNTKRLYALSLYTFVTITHATELSPPLPKLITQYGCQSCHAINAERSAPSFQAIAQRYKNSPAARDVLINKLRSGTAGAWGALPMPPQVMVPDEKRAVLIDWILTQSTPQNHTSHTPRTSGYSK